ncbi:hypothetical protein GCM10017673_19620 [Streptosporangium violaceochromogenes]|nr:hypothetical protein GCM10017673_19620 [Streptosporangium violaceochromogenes]
MTGTTTVNTPNAHVVTAATPAAANGAPSGTGEPGGPPDRRRRTLPDRLREAGGRIAGAVLAAHDAGVPF